jgi:hypothetical protein
MAGRDEPLIVVASDQGVRLRVRVPVWQRRSLSRAQQLTLELQPQMDDDAEIERHFVERRFSGRLADWRELPLDQRQGLAELVCQPPPEAIQHLAAGKEIRVVMHAPPWPWDSPLFRGGWLLVLLGVAGTVMAVGPSTARGAKETGEQDGDPAARIGACESDEAVLTLLGTKLRESIENGEVDANLLTACEWALDRHRARAIRLLAGGLGKTELSHPLRLLTERTRSSSPSISNGVLTAHDLQRLFNIVGAVCHEELLALIVQLRRELETASHCVRQPR